MSCPNKPRLNQTYDGRQMQCQTPFLNMNPRRSVNGNTIACTYRMTATRNIVELYTVGKEIEVHRC
jgi:hypothetical protein